MSAIVRTTDSSQTLRHVREVPIPDSCTATNSPGRYLVAGRLSIGCAITGLGATAASNHAGGPADVWPIPGWRSRASRAVSARLTVIARQTVTRHQTTNSGSCGREGSGHLATKSSASKSSCCQRKNSRRASNPPPLRLASVSVPRSALTSCWAMARPSPVPPVSRLREASIR
jgi:hypothetical protein